MAGVAKADGGKTVAEIFAEKDALANQQVTLRGKVVKINAGVMNMDWLHVRDGSGAEGTNDLTVTTVGAARGESRRHRARHGHGHDQQGLRHGLPVPRDPRKGRRQGRGERSDAVSRV